MDHLITRPLKRLLSNSKEFAKKQISDFYNFNSVQYSANSDEAVIMTEIKSIIRASPKLYADTDIDNSTQNITKPAVKLNVSFQSAEPKINTVEDLNADINENELASTNLNNVSVQRVTVKMVEPPVKEIATILDLNKTDISGKSELETVEIKNELNESIQVADIKKRKPVIKVKVKFIKETDKSESAPQQSEIVNTELSEEKPNIIEDKIDECVSNENLDSEQIELTQGFDNKHNVDEGCIFDENKSRPLSPILVLPTPEPVLFRPVEDLIDFHERQMHQLTGRTAKTLPRMGTSALYNRSPESKSRLDDSEIISALVRDRFVVNMYESRNYKRSMKRPSRYGRIYRSLERAVGTNNTEEDRFFRKFNSNKTEIVSMKQSSPIKLQDRYVSLNTTNNNVVAETIFDNIEELPTPEMNLEEPMSLPIMNLYPDEQNQQEIVLSEEFIKELDRVSLGSVCNEESGVILNSEYTDSNTNSQEKNSETVEKHMESTIDADSSSYNMEDFLKKALGEELSNYSNLDSTTEVESKTEDPLPLPEPESKPILHEDSVCTSDASDLISKINTFQSNFYRSLTKKLQHMSDTLKSPSAPKHEEVEISDELNSIFPNNEQVTALVRQAAVQYEAMKQITKALQLCRNTKEFSVSTEQIEAERLLLVATYKRQAILDEIRRLDYEIEENASTSTETGTLMISEVTLPLKDDSSEQTQGPPRRDHHKWYVAIFSCGPRVVATQPTLARLDGSVRFAEEVIFTELPSDFSINMEVHCLVQRKTGRNFSHESKYHIDKETKSSHCPTPKKILHREKKSQRIPARFDTGVRTSSFKLCGCLKLKVADLSKSGPWYMRKVPLCSVLSGAVSLQLQGCVQVPVRHSGFLTVGTEAGECVSWNRRWCVLEGHTLRYWNYPCEEDSCSPLRELDLKYCVNARVQLVNRSLCARPRTLLLETARPPRPEDKDSMMMTCSGAYTIVRLLLSADSPSELQTWEMQLNTVVTALRTWHVGYLC